MTVAQVTILSLTVLGIALYGYCLMRRLDKYLNARSISNRSSEIIKQSVLIFGEPETAEPLIRHLEERGITYRVTPRPELSEDTALMAVAALSGNDLDNLLLCAQVKRLCPDALSFAVCNDMTYKNVFNSAGVSRIYTRGPGQPALPEALKGWIDRDA